MDVRTCLIVFFCLMGFTCADPVKFMDCGEFDLAVLMRAPYFLVNNVDFKK